MKEAPTFEEIFTVMSAASIGDSSARVVIPPHPDVEHLPTRFAIALNILLDDLAERSARRLRDLLDSVQDYAIFMLDPGGTVTSWTGGAQRVFGYLPDEVLGKPMTVFLEPEGAEAAMRDELRVAHEKGRVEVEGLRVRKDGTRFWGNVVISAVRDGEGEIIGFAKITRDLTERRQAEEALRIANRELEAFSYSVAHDLRQPLRGMNGYAHLLLDEYGGKLDADGKKWLQSIVSNAEKMAELIDGLLGLARVTRSELRRTRVDLVGIANDIVGRLRANEPGREVEVVMPDRLEVDADASLARALLENLLGNAWKFTSKTAKPRLELGGRDHEGARAFFVSDNGAGFDMAFVGRLFGPFQRLHGVNQFPGHGIGLATALRIVQRHGGRIWAEGVVDAGATFHFTLAPTATSPSLYPLGMT